MTATRVLATFATALAAVGCGATETPPHNEAMGAVRSFLAACAEEEGTAAAETLTESTRAAFLDAGDTIAGCEKVLHVQEPYRPPLVAAESFRKAAVAEVHTAGGFGSAVVIVDGKHSHVELEEVGRRWRVSSPKLD